MTDYKQGDVILISFKPESSNDGFNKHENGGKKRPALVLSSLAHNQATGELVIAQITSRAPAQPRSGDYQIAQWQAANLPGPALVRCRLATIRGSWVAGKLGEMAAPDLIGVKQALSQALPG